MVKIRPYKIDLDQALHYGFRSGQTMVTTYPNVGIFFTLLRCRICLIKCNVLKRSSRSTIRVSNSVDPDHDRHYDKSVIYIRPGLSPKCLQMYQQTT